MDQAQQGLVAVVGVVGVDVLRQGEHQLVLAVQPVAELEAELGVALVGAVEAVAVQVQLAAVGMDQAQRAVGGGGEVIGGEGL
ncbi:hypothetical protein D3C86_1917240 [compost metagenome]